MISLSILIPTYNRANKLLRLLKTLESEIAWLKLDSPIQVLVSDNASIDETLRLIADFSTSVFQLKYFRQPQNLKFDGNVKFLYEKAQTDYVWFISDDDIPLPSAILTILKGLDKYNPDALLFSFIQPPGSTYKVFNLPNYYELFTDPKTIIEFLSCYPKLSTYVLRKISFGHQQVKELEPFLGSGFFFISLSFSVVGASIQPKLCIISQFLATCDEDYVKFNFDPNNFLEMYKLFYHPFVMKYLPNLAKSKIDYSYIIMIEALYAVKLGTIIVSEPGRYDKAIKNTKIRLFALLKVPGVFRHLILMKFNLVKKYKRISWIFNLPIDLIEKFCNLLRKV